MDPKVFRNAQHSLLKRWPVPNFGPSWDLYTRTQERNCTNYLSTTKVTSFGPISGHHETYIPEPKRETVQIICQLQRWPDSAQFRAIIKPIYQNPRKKPYKLSINYKVDHFRYIFLGHHQTCIPESKRENVQIICQLQSWPDSAYFVGHHQTYIQEPKKETIQIIYKLQRWQFSVHFSGHRQTFIPEDMKETVKIMNIICRNYTNCLDNLYCFFYGFWFTGLKMARKIVWN